MLNIKKIFQRSTIASVIISLLYFSTPIEVKAEEKSPKRIAFFVNGFTDCCVDKMTELQLVFSELGFEIVYNGWDSVSPITGSQDAINNYDSSGNGTKRFVSHMHKYIERLDGGTELYLIGHSFGGDSILQFLDSYDSNFRTDKTQVRIKLAAVIDPTGKGGLRNIATNNTVHSNVDYFYNRWQKNALDGVDCIGIGNNIGIPAAKNCVPFDSRITDGKIASCKAKIKCDEKEQNLARNADGSSKKISCEAHEVTCEGWRLPGCNVGGCWKGSNGTKQKRLFHSPMPYDDYIQQEIIDITKTLLGSDPPPPPPRRDTLSIPVLMYIIN